MIAIVHALQTVRLKVVKLRLLVTWILGNALMGAKLDSGRMTAPVHALIARIINATKPMENVLRAILENSRMTAPVPAQAARIIYVTSRVENVLRVLLENGGMTALNHVLIARIIHVTLRLEFVVHVWTGK